MVPLGPSPGHQSNQNSNPQGPNSLTPNSASNKSSSMVIKFIIIV